MSRCLTARRNSTTPEEAKQFVETTGVDVLAPAIGNSHGMLQTMVDGNVKKRLRPGTYPGN